MLEFNGGSYDWTPVLFYSIFVENYSYSELKTSEMFQIFVIQFLLND